MRILAGGLEISPGERLETNTILAALDRIDADPELSARLDALDEGDLRSKFLELCRAETRRQS